MRRVGLKTLPRTILDSQAFYRKLFLIRYTRLLQKAEQTYKLPAAVMELLREEILSLEWIDKGVAHLTAPS